MPPLARLRTLWNVLTILLTRHGLADAGDVMLGAHLDPPLRPKGRAQARALARHLAGLPLDRIVSSPLRRALETAEIVARGRLVETDARLVELDYGAWEGLTYVQMQARDPGLRERWEADPARTRPPGGETAAEVAARCESFLADFLAEAAAAGPVASEAQPGQGDAPGGRPRRVLVSAHGSLNRILLSVALGLPPADYRRRLTQDRANLTVLHYAPEATVEQARVIVLNDVSHLRERGEPPWTPTFEGMVAANAHRAWQDPSGRG